MLKHLKLLFFPLLFLMVIFFFSSAFSMNFFKDDFFFLKISRIHSIGEFIGFFSPIRTYSYKPIASEAFYFLIGRNALAGHIVTFITYFIGLYFLYKVIYFLSKNVELTKLTVVLYSLSSVHVFQLYWLATFQEVLVLTTLSASFYLYLQKKYTPSVLLYICALLSKETAILYAIFLCLFYIFSQGRLLPFGYTQGKLLRQAQDRNDIKRLLPYIIVSILFFLIYQYSLKFVTSLDNYKLSFNPRLILNNAMWYYLWSWGAPSFMPDYMKSVFSRPIPEFWAVFATPHVKLYFYLLISYIVLFFTSLVMYITQNQKTAIKILVFFICSLIGFYIFLGPILLFPHKWMIRLTLPLIFISLFQGYVLFLFSKSKILYRYIFGLLICLYLIMSYFGVRMHENTSMFSLESQIVTNADTYFEKSIQNIKPASTIYFMDSKADPSYCVSWGGCSKKLENTFHGSYFLDYYFPDKNMRVEYKGINNSKKINGYRIYSSQFIK